MADREAEVLIDRERRCGLLGRETCGVFVGQRGDVLCLTARREVFSVDRKTGGFGCERDMRFWLPARREVFRLTQRGDVWRQRCFGCPREVKIWLGERREVFLGERHDIFSFAIRIKLGPDEW